MGVAEANLESVNGLFKNKREIQWALRMCEKETKVDISIRHQPIVIRQPQLVEMLKVELAYTNRMLKSFGVTELSEDS